MPPFPIRISARAIRVSPISTTRTFSILTRARTAIHNLEPHSHSILPKAGKQAIAKPDYRRLAKHVAGPALFYFPWMATYLGWYFLAEYGMNGTVAGHYLS